MKKGSSANAIKARASASAASSRPVGMSGSSGRRAVRPNWQERAEGAPVPQIALARPDRAQADHLTIQLPALHGQKQRRRAGIAAHHVHMQAENFPRNEAKDQVARCRVVGADGH
jgi:hypothetical protein